ncbi:ATP synthase regulation protein NCA2-domain-containing protein [Lentinula raphanica]|nr:ATP synthase regulation protein NCA2-domain-containing protein [Lentinula raphanica]
MAPPPSFIREFVKPLPVHSYDQPDHKNALRRLQDLHRSRTEKGGVEAAGFAQQAQDETIRERGEEDDLTRQILASAYARALQSALLQAVEAETEAEWWSDVERTKWRVLWYLIQTLPCRVYDLLQTMAKATEELRWSRPPPEIVFPSLFPHLQHRPRLHRITTFRELRLPRPTSNVFEQTIESIRNIFYASQKVLLVPLHYTLQEVSLKKQELLRIRDDCARTLGSLVLLRPEVQKCLDSANAPLDSKNEQFTDLTTDLLIAMKQPDIVYDGHNQYDSRLIRLSTLLDVSQQDSLRLHSLGLSRPSRLTRMWPRLVFGPPLFIYSTYYLYSSRGTLLSFVHDAKDVIQGFILDWCIKPLAGVLDTVKASKNDQAGWLVTKEGVQADHDSLERMARALAADHLRYSPSQLDDLSARIRLGDLTPVLKLYEEDIKSPFKSAVGGTLLRTVFIQASKVDLDQALSGIDRLMKSQELTFAFVGLSPAMVIVYLVGGYVTRMIWPSNSGKVCLFHDYSDKGKYGGRKERERVFWAMRRVERLLILDKAHDESTTKDSSSSTITPHNSHPSALTTGLLILSLTQLRTYAERHLPSGSSSSANQEHSFSATSLREAFLEDLSDLQDPVLGVDQKRMVVERMWRCWAGTVFGRAK